MKPRFQQSVLILSFLPLCWLGMMAVHELGHVLAAWGTGGTVTNLVLHPLAISRTDVSPNPRPHIVVWSGPLVGVTLPLLLSGLFRFAKLPGAYLPRFFAGFCLIANGAYLGIGSFAGIGDAGEMLRLETPMWVLWLFGAVTLPAGLWLWHNLGRHFGLGKSQGRVEASAAYVSLLLLVLAVTATCLLSSPT